METEIVEIAQRIKGLREVMEFSKKEMAETTNLTLEEYEDCEEGRSDFSFTFLHACAKAFGVDIVELMTGENPRLTFYDIVRAGKGLPLKRRRGFTYQHLAYRMKDKLAETFLITAPYSEEEQNKPIALSNHKGQEFDYILKGSLKVQLDDHVEVLGEGDAIYYRSDHDHGMIAAGGRDCLFIAVVIDDDRTDDEKQTWGSDGPKFEKQAL